MNMFRYSDVLNRSMFISDILEFKIPDDSIILGIVDNNDAYAIITTINELNSIKISFVETYSVLELYTYYKNLVAAICRTIGKSYSDDVLDIVTAYAFPETIIPVDNMNEVLTLFEKSINTNLESDDDDEVWYMQETAKYKLLNLYTQYDAVDNIDKIRALLSIVKANKEKYDNITATIESIK